VPQALLVDRPLGWEVVEVMSDANNGGDVKDAWRRLRDGMSAVDPRDLDDAARWWAADEARLVDCPDTVGGWRASLSIAFEAGRRWAMRGTREQ
jgi:hypothetical protein